MKTKHDRKHSWPLVLVSADIESRGKEFEDISISLSGRYQSALEASGALPLAMAPTVSPRVIAECVRRCDGVLLTGGDDVDPRIYDGAFPQKVREKIQVTPDKGGRDFRELLMVREALEQKKPLLAICRGHQVLNVALGGTLLGDVALQKPGGIDHRRLDRRAEVVHEVHLTPGSLLASIVRKQRLGVNSTHHQAVASVAPPLNAGAVSPDGIVESLELRPELASLMPFLLSVQFHPERLVDRYPAHQAIFNAFTQACVLAKQ